MAFVERWVVHAKELLRTKYQVTDLQNPYGQSDLHVSIMLLPQSDDNADTGTTRFRCCYDTSGESHSNGSFARIPYLTPSHKDWDRSSTWGALGRPTNDYHAKNIVHEVIHAGQFTIYGYRGTAPQWVQEGLAEYEGMFNANEYDKTAVLDSLARYVHDRIPDSIFLATSPGSGAPSITTSDVYFGGSLILKYLADRFGEDIHNRLVRHTHATFDEVMAAEFEVAGTTAPEVVNDLQAWLGQRRGEGTPTPKPLPSTGLLPDTNNVRWLE